MNNNLPKIIICLSLFCLLFSSSAEAKRIRVKEKQLYMLGVAISPIDSAVFITDMHLVEGVTVEKKHGFLMDRQLYSLQLRRFLEAEYNGGTYVTAVYFSPKRKKMERKYLSLYKRYSQGKEMRPVLVDRSKFRFHGEKYIEQLTDEMSGATNKKESKKAKKAKKE